MLSTTYIIPQSFYKYHTPIVAGALLGKIIIRTIGDVVLSGRIIETEAYDHTDEACHPFKGKTARNASLFGPVGHAYVYFTYGLHHCFNLVAYDHTVGGVLIRAVKPLEGIERMMAHRNQSNIKILTNGPGKLTQAFLINKEHDGHDMTKKSYLYIASDGFKVSIIHSSPRIGISKNKDMQWRFTY